MFNLSKKNFKRMDFVLLFTIIALVIYGLVVLNSAMHPLGRDIFSQIVATVMGLIMIGFIFLVDLDFLKKIKWVLYLISTGLLIATILFGTGGQQWGANLWLNFGPINVQPSELSKVLHILFLAGFLGDNRKRINTWKFIFQYAFVGFLPVALIVIQRDLGTAMVLAMITAVMLFISGLSWKKIAIILGVVLIVALIALPFVWEQLGDYAKDRLIDFQNTDRNLATSTHQTDRGLIALGSGQLTGRGYMSGPFSQNMYIPEQHTDFIFPVLVEDFGFMGGLALIILYGIMFIRLIRVAMRADETYHTTLVMGVFTLLFVHIVENMGMTMQITPVTGIPLPFFSNGGTFQLINLTLIGFVLSISMYRKSLEF